MKTRRPDWIFDDSAIPDDLGRGEKAISFIRRLCHPKAKDKGFDLPRFQERIVRKIYGPTDSNGERIVKTVFLMMPRGGRKTTLGAALGLLHTFGYERINGGQALAAAAAEDQALLAFDEARSIVNETPWLSRHAKITESENLIEYKKSRTSLLAISSDGDVQLGKTPSFVLADELIAWQKRNLWRALRTGLVKTPGSLLIIITQAGRGQQNLAYEMYDYARRVEAGSIYDPGFLPIIFEASEKDDWHDERIWHAVNPGLELGFPDLSGLRQLAREAAERPADRDDFRQFNLNVWMDYSASPFVDMETYDEGAVPVDLGSLRNRPCWLAVDLGLNRDLSAVVAAWPDDNDGYDLATWFFCPADNLQLRADRDRVPYPRWAHDGFITPTPGNVTDYRIIEQKIRSLCEEFQVQEIAFDPAYAQAIMNPLTEDGYPTATMRQGWVTMAPAIKELERAILGRKLRHGGNPVLRWNIENVAVETDKAGNKSFHKGKSRDRIDGAVAAAMAVSRASLGDRSKSILDGEMDPQDFFVTV